MLGLVYTTAQAQLNPPQDAEAAGELTIQDHGPGSGFKLIDSKVGTLSFSTYFTMRYLNQLNLDDTYTDSFGRPFDIDKRNDFLFQKATLYFKGWIASPNFKYLGYVWTSNASQGQGAQVVVAGNLQYRIEKYLEIGAGVGGLPTSRSLIGQWPFWLRQDARPMAEEFFRGSFTMGVWAEGEIARGLNYKTMLGNNLSQLGVDAGQLDNGFDTWSTSLWWTTKNFGRSTSYGDFERHEKVAVMLGGAFTRSNEDRQSQPGSDAPENSQIRLSDGTGIFSINAFNNGSSVIQAKYRMASFNAGLKYKGFSLDGEYFMRWVSDFVATGPLPVSNLFDTGFAVQGSGMLVDKKLQLYSTASYVNGEYGKPWEVTAGLNWFIFDNKVLRINPEVIFIEKAPVGYINYPYPVGATGTTFMINLELFF